MRSGRYPRCSWDRRSDRVMSCQRASKVSASRGASGAGQGGYPAAVHRARCDAGSRCRVCSRHGVGSTGPSLPGNARAVFATSLLHIQAHLVSRRRHHDLAGGSISRNCIQNLRASQGFRNFREIYDVLQQLQQKDNISEKSSNQHRTQDSQV